MRWLWRFSNRSNNYSLSHFLVQSLCLSFFIAVCRSQKAPKATKNVAITADDEKLRDPEGYAAIVQLHHQMDDDQSGSIDRFESNDFLKEDMKFGGSDREKREKAFHHNNDEQITVDDLWEAWFASEERTWTTAQLMNWLENSVKLPQYSNNLIARNIDGRALPRMAVANSSFLSHELGIKNAVHKHKIHLKALDVVLFGFSGDGSSRMKDIALSILLLILITVLILYKRQRSRSQHEMEQLSSKLNQLKTMENDFVDVQQKFEEERKRRQSVCEAIVTENEQMETLRSQLLEAERLLESTSSAPLALQPLLRRTCELEMSYVGQQRLECITEMREAIELIDKLRKKQSSLMSSIKLATGGSTGTDQIDSRIFSLKARMEKISLAMEECQQRWIEIESLCGFPLMLQSNGAELNFMGHHQLNCPSNSNSTLNTTTPTSSVVYQQHLPRASSSILCQPTAVNNSGAASFYRNTGASSSTSALSSSHSTTSTVIGGPSNVTGLRQRVPSPPSSVASTAHSQTGSSISHPKSSTNDSSIHSSHQPPPAHLIIPPQHSSTHLHQPNAQNLKYNPPNAHLYQLNNSHHQPLNSSSNITTVSYTANANTSTSNHNHHNNNIPTTLYDPSVNNSDPANQLIANEDATVHSNHVYPQTSLPQQQQQHFQQPNQCNNYAADKIPYPKTQQINDEMQLNNAYPDALLPFKREMRSRFSKGSLCSTDSNDDESENGSLRNQQSISSDATTTSKKRKILHLFRKNKHHS